MPLPDSSDIDAALIAKLSGDAQLKSLCPDGVFFDEGPPNLRNFVIVSLFYTADIATYGQRAIEDLLYVVKAITFGTSGATVKPAAYRIDQLLENQPLIVAGYGWMTTNREQRVRYQEDDAIDPTIHWQHRGGHYRVQLSLP